MRNRKRHAHGRLCLEPLERRLLLSGGALDSNFGTGGIATAPIFGPTTDSANSVAVQQTDGKILVAGITSLANSLSEIELTRCTPKGSLDTSFGRGGSVLTDFQVGESTAGGVAIQADGKIVVAGTINGRDFAVARYNTSGSLDASFGTGGEVTTSFGLTALAAASALVIQPDGKIVAAGNFSSSEFAVVRYNTNGSLDTSFGNGGKLTTAFGATTSFASGMTLQPDGKIVVAGTASVGTNTDDFVVARYDTNGGLDTSFGSGGKVTTSFGSSMFAVAAGVAIEPHTGAIVVAGRANGDFALARYNVSNGSLDTTFGSGGEVTTSFGSNFNIGGALLIQTNGDIVETGSTINNANGNFNEAFALARYKAVDGSLDTSFGNGGTVTTSFGSNPSRDSSAALQSDGRIVALGTVEISGPSSGGNLALARYNTDGSLDTSFGNGGEVTTNVSGPGVAGAAAEAIQRDGKIVVVGVVTVLDNKGNLEDDFAVARFNPDASLDASFGQRGQVLTDFGQANNVATAVAIQSDGKIVVAGTAFVRGFSTQVFAVARYNPDGSLDASFGIGGLANANFGSKNLVKLVSGVAITPGGQIVAAGSIANSNLVDEFALARFSANGHLDTTFGSRGKVITSFGSNARADTAGMTIQADGKIVVAGTVDSDFGVARYNPNGSLDTSFGTGGLVTTSFGAPATAIAAGVVVRPDGKIVVAGSVTNEVTLQRDIALVRYNLSGSLDTSFGTGGEVLTNFGTKFSPTASGLSLQTDGRIVVTGTFIDSTGAAEFGVARYNTDGSLDTRFGTGGLVTTGFNSGEANRATAVAIASNGDIIVVGTSFSIDDLSDVLTVASYLGN
jgi:uncharacterized delta-60 repeat protein